jgi:hypothetical protein
LFLEIVVEPAIAAREALAVVSVAKRLDNPGRVRHLLGRSPFVTTGRLAKALGRRRRVEKSFEKHLAVAASERQHLTFADGTGRDLFSTAHDKISQRPACEIGRVLE